MSIFSSASFKNLGHYFAVATGFFVKAAKFAYQHQATIQGLSQVAAVAEQAAGVPASVTQIQDASFGALGHIYKVIDSGKQRNPDGSLDLGAIESAVVDAALATKGLVDQFGQATGMPKPQTSPAQPAPATAPATPATGGTQ